MGPEHGHLFRPLLCAVLADDPHEASAASFGPRRSMCSIFEDPGFENHDRI